jgi:hypothetical protein
MFMARIMAKTIQKKIFFILKFWTGFHFLSRGPMFFSGEEMYRKIWHSGFGAAFVLVGLMVFTACKLPSNSPGDPTGQIRITGIPATAKGKASYKVFVQLSTGVSATFGYVAKGDALINEKDSVVMALYDGDGKPWSGSGIINMAIVLSPAKVDTWKDIDVYAGQTTFSSEVQSFAWAAKDMLHLGVELSPGKFLMEEQVKQIFDGGDSDKPGIICVPESGIEYPQKP